jgi:hypothetical protein
MFCRYRRQAKEMHDFYAEPSFYFIEKKMASKLLKLLDWLTLPDAATHLSLLFGEEVTVAQILRLALDGRLRLSVRFVNSATAYVGRRIPIDEAEFREVRAIDGIGSVRLYKGPTLFSGDVKTHVIELEDEIVELSGLYDLPMIGDERLDVEHAYQHLTGGPSVTDVTLDGAFVEGKDGELYQLREKLDSGSPGFFPASLPEGYVLVARVAMLREFEQIVNDDQEKPVSTKERNSLLCIIAVLCKVAKVDFRKHAKAAGIIQREADILGVGLAETTIENHLKRIPDALAFRNKS